MKLLASFFLLLSIQTASSQFLEFGGGIGIFGYAGDLSRGYNPLESKFGAFGVYRMNFSEFVSFKTSLGIGSLAGNDDNPIDPLGEARSHSFSTGITELSGVLEYHFLDFRNEKSPIRWSPFVFGGFGLARLGEVNGAPDDFNQIQAIVPFGIGFKQLIGKQFGLSLEIGTRKTFTDYIDGVSDTEQTVKNFEFGHPTSKDWIFFTGVSFTYILYKIPCPFPYIPNKSMFKR